MMILKSLTDRLSGHGLLFLELLSQLKTIEIFSVLLGQETVEDIQLARIHDPVVIDIKILIISKSGIASNSQISILFDEILNCIWIVLPELEVGLVLPIIPIQCKTGRQYNVILSSIADFQIQQTINSILLVYMKTKTNKISDDFQC